MRRGVVEEVQETTMRFRGAVTFSWRDAAHAAFLPSSQR